MVTKRLTIVIIGIFLVGVGFFLLTRGEQFELPRGETVLLQDSIQEAGSSNTITVDDDTVSGTDNSIGETKIISAFVSRSTRNIFVTDGVKHSIPLNEILAGGPSKDGIPSLDNPKFTNTREADVFLNNESPGLGLVHKGEARFYPYQILVWHEIANDTIAGDPILVTYCPLCLTGIVFDRRIDGKEVEFGVSGKLWQSNLLMYNRAENPDQESLWSQVLGEAVLGEKTGMKLTIILSDAVRYGDWKKKHPDTKVLSRETGEIRPYGRDPYGGYYTDNTVSFGASFNDDRLHPKEFVLGVEINGKFKAYHAPSLPEGTTIDEFAGKKITVEKSDIGEVRIFIGEEKQSLPYIGGFWFSWLAVHPDTELYQ